MFGCRRELPSEGLPDITEILVASFGALRAVNVISRDNHRVHLEGFPPSGLQTMPCKRASSKEERQSLSCQGLIFLPPDAASPLFFLDGSAGAFSKELSPLLADQEPPYEEALNWLQFAFTGDTKIQYAEPSHNALSFSSPVEGGPLFLPALERLQTFYPRAYVRGAASTSEGAGNWDLNVKLSACTHPGTAGLDSSLGGGAPPHQTVIASGRADCVDPQVSHLCPQYQ